ncbi:MAG: electron transport complex subunit RsxC [Bacteroidales bacterium]|nr:electron transport complex subunit RsxC [Bacteroidales bacterium]
MKSNTFSIGGVHPHEWKKAASSPIEDFPLPEEAAVSMAQHLGSPAEPVVAKGDKVLVGQLIGRATSFVSAPVHSPYSGTVKAVEPRADIAGNMVMHVVITVEGDQWLPEIDRTPDVPMEVRFSAEEILAKIKDAGIVGLGGAAFPTHIKLNPQKKVECLIINGTECEPCLTSDDRIMREYPRQIIMGARLMMRALGTDTCYIGIEENKPEAIQALGDVAAYWPGQKVVVLRKKYPQGGEKQLIDAVIGRRVPSLGLPIDTGAVVQNVGTALAVYEAVQKNKPLIDNVFTLTGPNLEVHRNFRVRVGTPYSKILAAAGNLPEGPLKLISGGPLMGKAIANIEATTLKASSSLLILSGDMVPRNPEMSCIRCGKCVEACPMGLEPYLLNRLCRAGGRQDELEKERIYDCIECGCCQFTCPSYIPLLDMIRTGKAEVMKIMRSRSKK